MPRRPSFLPTFFTVLAIGFVIAVVAKVHSYSGANTGTGQAESRAAGSSAQTGGVPMQPSEAPSAPAPGSAGPASAGTSPSQVEVERQRRYQELLNNPPAAGGGAGGAGQRTGAIRTPMPVNPQPKPSLLSRITTPIVNAFGGGHNENGPSRIGSGGVGNSPQPKNDKPTTGTSGDANDPNSDTTPPRLASISFDPPEVQDGQSVTVLVSAADEGSGIRSISGNVIGPSGALIGFAVEKQSDAGLYATRMSVPVNATEGQWHVNFLSLSDLAGNSSTLSWRQGTVPQTAQFRVTSSRSDSTPPTLRSVMFERPVMRAGEKDRLLIEADDDKSGIYQINGLIASPSKFAHIPFGCHSTDGTAWQCEVTAPANADCGSWQLEQVQLQDKANNLAVVRTDNPMVGQTHVNISSDSCDSQPPQLQSVSVDPPVVGAPGTLNVIAVATDDASGVQSINGQFTYTGPVQSGNQPPRLFFSLHPGGDGQTWTGPVAIAAKTARGVWRLSSLQLVDKAGNLKVYIEGNREIANITFRIQ